MEFYFHAVKRWSKLKSTGIDRIRFMTRIEAAQWKNLYHVRCRDSGAISWGSRSKQQTGKLAQASTTKLSLQKEPKYNINQQWRQRWTDKKFLSRSNVPIDKQSSERGMDRRASCLLSKVMEYPSWITHTEAGAQNCHTLLIMTMAKGAESHGPTM